jgi:hypothetical protein
MIIFNTFSLFLIASQTVKSIDLTCSNVKAEYRSQNCCVGETFKVPQNWTISLESKEIVKKLDELAEKSDHFTYALTTGVLIEGATIQTCSDALVTPATAAFERTATIRHFSFWINTQTRETLEFLSFHTDAITVNETTGIATNFDLLSPFHTSDGVNLPIFDAASSCFSFPASNKPVPKLLFTKHPDSKGTALFKSERGDFPSFALNAEDVWTEDYKTQAKYLWDRVIPGPLPTLIQPMTPFLQSFDKLLTGFVNVFEFNKS